MNAILRRIGAGLAALVFALSSFAQVGGPVIGQAGTPGLTSAASVAITGGTITGTNVPYVLAKAGIPFISISSGSMGNNGAVTGLTALPMTYSGGAWAWFPAGAVAAGVPAAASWLWFVGSSATAGTVFNSTYTTGIPTTGTQTAFATTGPGAFVGDTGEVFGPQITVPAGALGTNGQLELISSWAANNTAGVKTGRIRFSGTAGTQYAAVAMANQVSGPDFRVIANANSASAQKAIAVAANGTGGFAINGSVVPTGTDNTANATTLVWSLQKATATDNLVLEVFTAKVLP